MYIVTDKKDNPVVSKKTGKRFEYSTEALAHIACAVFSNSKMNRRTGRKPKFFVWDAKDFDRVV